MSGADAAADVSLSLDGLLNGLPPPRPSSVLLRLWRRNGDETKNAVDVGKAQDLLYILWFKKNTLVRIRSGAADLRANFSPLKTERQARGKKIHTRERAFSSVQTVDSQTDFVR